MSGSPAWGPNKQTGNIQGIWPWRPAVFDHRTSTGLGETETPVLEGTNKSLCALSLRGREQWDHRRLNQNYLLVLEGLLWRHVSAGDYHRDGDTGNISLGRSPWCKSSWVAISQTTEPVDPRAGSPLAKKLPGRECNTTHQQIIGLKLYWARLCPPEQDPVFPTTSPSHKEANMSSKPPPPEGRQKEEPQSHTDQNKSHITEN